MGQSEPKERGFKQDFKEDIRSKFFFFNSFIHMCIYCLGHFSTLPPSLFPPSPAQFQAGPVLHLSLVLLKKRHKHNKEDKAFLLLELRIAIQKYS
jgi:hypothetical protein